MSIISQNTYNVNVKKLDSIKTNVCLGLSINALTIQVSRFFTATLSENDKIVTFDRFYTPSLHFLKYFVVLGWMDPKFVELHSDIIYVTENMK